MRNRTFGLIALALIIVCIGVIIGFTLQNADRSGQTSGKVTALIVRLLNPGYDALTSAEQQALVAKYDPIIRKIAHFTEYAILGLALGLFSINLIKLRRSWLIGIACGVLVAMADEFIQNLVPGRGPRITDVLIDAAGVVTGTALVYLIGKTVKNRKMNI